MRRDYLGGYYVVCVAVTGFISRGFFGCFLCGKYRLAWLFWDIGIREGVQCHYSATISVH